MAIKNIALDVEVYRRLSKYKRESESFSRAVSRMLEQIEQYHTGREIMARLEELPDLSQADAGKMMEVVAEDRKEAWEPDDLR